MGTWSPGPAVCLLWALGDFSDRAGVAVSPRGARSGAGEESLVFPASRRPLLSTSPVPPPPSREKFSGCRVPSRPLGPLGRRRPSPHGRPGGAGRLGRVHGCVCGCGWKRVGSLQLDLGWGEVSGIERKQVESQWGPEGATPKCRLLGLLSFCFLQCLPGPVLSQVSCSPSYPHPPHEVARMSQVLLTLCECGQRV